MSSYPITRLVAESLRLLAPPPQITLADWAERYFVLPEVSSARPGRFRLWPYQRGILDAIGNPEIARVSVIKSARIGYTKCLMAALGGRVDMDPCSIILLVPTDDDARRYAVEEVEPSFAESPKLAELISARADSRDTMTTKGFLGGGSLKILSARSPRNLRSHDAKVLLIDEEDGMDVTAEGDPVALAERRTMAHPDRKIVRGSTPTDELNSSINRAYNESDQRVFEVPCPHCGASFEILWEHIVWPRGEAEKAICVCPHCHDPIDERFKTQMVASGTWVAKRPQIKGHAGFRLNTLISLFHNAKWGILAAEFEKAKRAGPSELQAFANTVEGRVWKNSLDNLDENALAARVEDFGLARIPAEVLLIIAGVDTQDDRFEVLLWGFNESEAYCLAHHVIWGDPTDSVTQAELDAYLKQTWPHPNGWRIGIDSTAIDSQGHKTQAVYDFCKPRLARRIYPIISRVGSRRIWEPGKQRLDGVRLFIVGHDQAKSLVLDHLALPMLDENKMPVAGRCRFSNELPPETFDQLAGEKRQIRYVHNRVVVEFRPKKPGQRVEALDATCYAWACRRSMRVNWAERAARRAEAKVSISLSDLSAKLNR